jgi:hypothetical protein
MFADRLREFWSHLEPAVAEPTAVGSPCAFVLCPVPVLQFMTPWQYAQAACLYRLAYEQATAQYSQSRTLRIPAFSAN